MAQEPPAIPPLLQAYCDRLFCWKTSLLRLQPSGNKNYGPECVKLGRYIHESFTHLESVIFRFKYQKEISSGRSEIRRNRNGFRHSIPFPPTKLKLKYLSSILMLLNYCGVLVLLIIETSFGGLQDPGSRSGGERRRS
jgi:hypothetical protein